MTTRWANFYTEKSDNVERLLVQGVATCDNCGRASVGAGADFPGGAPEGVFSKAEKLTWYPSVGDAPEFPDVPVAIAQAAKEAHSSASIGAVMSAILMARTVVEATAKDKGVGAGSLFQKIDALAEASLIRASTKDAAHEIRHMGNDMAHGDIADVPSKDDAKEVLVLMDEVLNEVYQGPARTARLRAKRGAE